MVHTNKQQSHKSFAEKPAQAKRNKYVGLCVAFKKERSTILVPTQLLKLVRIIMPEVSIFSSGRHHGICRLADLDSSYVYANKYLNKNK